MKLYYERSQHLGFLFQRRIQYEKDILSKVLDEIKQNDTVFEIGSNIGQYSLLIAEKIGVNGKLICIEPDADNYAFLVFNLHKNKIHQAQVLNLAVAETEGRAVFYKDTLTGGRMGSLIREYTEDHFRGKTEEVEMITLKRLIENYGNPNFIKVDVEGAETKVFSDPSVLNPDTVYLIEVRKETKEYIFDLFKSKQFNIYLLGNTYHQVNEIKEIPDFANLLFKKK